MRFEVTIQETTQTFVFSEVQLPGTADLQNAVQEAQGYRDETLGLKSDVEGLKSSVETNAEQVADDKAIIEQLTLENQALRAENQILTNLSRDYNTQSANNAISAIQTNIGGTNGIDNILPVAQLMPGMGLNGINFSVARPTLGATNFNVRGLIDRALPNRPRFDFDPVTRNPLGVLVNSSASEFVRRNTQFESTSFTRTGLNTPAVSGSFGALPLRTIIPTTDNSGHRFVCQSFTGQNICHLKAIVEPFGYNFVTLYASGAGLRVARTFSLVDGSVSSPYNIQGNSTKAVATKLNGSAWLIELSAQITSSTQITAAGIAVAQSATGNFTDNGQTFSGDGVSGLKVAVLSARNQDFPVTINDTTNEVVIDSDNLTQTANSWNQTEGTIVVHVRPNTQISQSVFVANDGTVNNQLRLQADGTLTFTRSGVTQTLNLGGSLNTFSSYAISYAPNRVAGCRNGGTVQEITTAGNINVTNISYAPDVVGASKHVFAQYFARAMSNMSMQGKTGDFKFGQEPGDFALNQNLGELAFHSFQNLLAMGVADQTLRIRGTNALVTEVISRNYPFEVISLFTSTGGTITAQNITGIDSTLGYFPAGSVATLTFNATVGTVWDVAIRPRLTP